MNLGIAFSGGGFRATLFHLGVVRYLRDESRLTDVTHICSVSGGSVLAAHLVQNWERYTGSQKEFEQAASEVVDLVRSDVRGRILRRFLTCWPTLLFREGGRFDAWRVPATRLLEAAYHRQLFAPAVSRVNHADDTRQGVRPKQGVLDELSPDLSDSAIRPFCHILATNLNSGSVSSFTAEEYHYELQRDNPDWSRASSAPIALAVSASSAYPALFAPIRLTQKSLRNSNGFLHDEPHLLTDGGVYDNLGVRHFYSVLEKQRCFPLLRGRDLVDPEQIVDRLLSGEEQERPMPFARMWDMLAPEYKTAIGQAKNQSMTAGPMQNAVQKVLNHLIHRRELFDRNDWQSISLDPEADRLIQNCEDTPGRYDLFLRNRVLLEFAFPGMIAGCVAEEMKVIVSNAGRAFNRIKEIEFSDFILSTAIRASDVLMNRIAQIEWEGLHDDDRFVFISINETVDNVVDRTSPDEPIQRAVAQIRTDLDAFSIPEISGLVRHGYCVARQAFRPLLRGPSACQFEKPWDPVRPFSHDYKSTDVVDERNLEASKYRRKRLFSFRDWVSYLHLGLLGAMGLIGWVLWGWATDFVSELVLRKNAGVTFTNYVGPSLEMWETIDPYYRDNNRYRDADQIEEPDFRGFTIDSDDRIWDLQNWRPAGSELTVESSTDAVFQNWVTRWRQKPQDERSKLLRSQGEPSFLTREVRLSKKNDQPGVRNDVIRFQFLTAGFGIVPRLDTSASVRDYKWYAEQSKTLGSVGPRATKKWNIVVELPEEKPQERITLKLQALYWNGFQGQKNEWASIKLNGPTEEASFWILFPQTKPYDTYVLQQYLIGERASARIAEAMPLTNARKTKLFWRLPANPDPKEIYEVQWSW
jgi:predicted acylesterase/phospholipase RssA